MKADRVAPAALFALLGSVGCASSDGGLAGAPALWSGSSTALLIQSSSFYDRPASDGPPSSSASCARWSREAMTAEQLAFLSGIRLLESAPQCTLDGYSESRFVVTDADSSTASYLVERSSQSCAGNAAKKQWMLPESVANFPRDGASPCVPCNELSACEQGTCLNDVCVF